MKLWQKVFLGTFLLFEVLFNTSSFYLIEHNFNSNLSAVIERGLSEQMIIQSQVRTDWTYLSTLNGQIQLTSNAQDFLENNADKYTRFFNSNEVFLEILDNQDKTVFTSFPGKNDKDRQELNLSESDDRKYIIRDVEGRTYLFISGNLSLGAKAFKLIYIRDISKTYQDKSSQVSLFFKINIVITIILAGGLYLLIWYLTRSIRSLNESARAIAGGGYSQRVPISSSDEIGILAENFNQMAEAVESKVAELEKNVKSRQLFINYLTHELKTPLTSIIGYADLLRTAKYNEETFFKALTYIYSEGKRLESLSFKLMDLILIGNKKPEMEYMDIAVICGELEAALKPQLENKQITLLVKAESYTMLLERDLFKLLCSNLLDNAIKASDVGGQIVLRGSVIKDMGYVLDIQDHGVGISSENISRIFEPFFVVDSVQSKANHGFGLGLAICAEIVRLHEGQIDVESKLCEGTTVKIRFFK